MKKTLSDIIIRIEKFKIDKLNINLLYGIDATKLCDYQEFKEKSFDTVLFNLPIANDIDHSEIEPHQALLFGFLKNAKTLVKDDDIIQVLFPTTQPYHQWNLEGHAKTEGVQLSDKVDFHRSAYPKYKPVNHNL